MEESGALCVQKSGTLIWASLPANSWDTPGKTIRKALSEVIQWLDISYLKLPSREGKSLHLFKLLVIHFYRVKVHN